jgi:hypothetical protein
MIYISSNNVGDTLIRNMGMGGGGWWCIVILVLTKLYVFFVIFRIYGTDACNYD